MLNAKLIKRIKVIVIAKFKGVTLSQTICHATANYWQEQE